MYFVILSEMPTGNLRKKKKERKRKQERTLTHESNTSENNYTDLKQSHAEITSVRVGFQYFSAEYVNRLNKVPGLYCTFNLISYLICTDLAHSPLLVHYMNH